MLTGAVFFPLEFKLPSAQPWALGPVCDLSFMIRDQTHSEMVSLVLVTDCGVTKSVLGAHVPEHICRASAPTSSPVGG